MKRIAMVFGVLTIAATCGLQAQTLTDVQKAGIEKEIREQVAQYFHTAGTLDLEALDRFYSREKWIAIVYPNGRFKRSFEPVSDTAKNQYALIKEDRIEIQDVIVGVFSQDYALSICSGSVRHELKDGKINNFTFVYTHIWVKEPSGWKIAYMGQSTGAKQ